MAKEDNMGNQEEKFIEKDERDVRISKINILNMEEEITKVSGGGRCILVF